MHIHWSLLGHTRSYIRLESANKSNEFGHIDGICSCIGMLFGLEVNGNNYIIAKYFYLSFFTYFRYRPSEKDDSEVKKISKKKNFISYLCGHSDENIIDRVFRPKKICDEASAHLVNAMVIFAGH